MKLCHSLVTLSVSPPYSSLSRHPKSLSSELPSHRVNVAESLHSETLKILEWPSVCTQLAAFTSTSMGLAAAQTARIPLGKCPDDSRRLLAQTSAAVDISQPLDFSGIEDVSAIVETSVAGEMLSTRELCSVQRTLRAIRALLEQLEDISAQNDLSKRASEELEIIRLERKGNMENLESTLKQVSARIFQAGGIDRPLVTKRRSRMCVAIRANRRSLLPGGVVLDTSSSGATYFMEPREAIELNNQEVRLMNSERLEEQAIMSLLTAETAQSERQIKYLLDRVLEVDLAFARAAHARWMNGVCPNFIAEGYENLENNALSVDIDGIKHPLLLESSLRKFSDFNKSSSSLSSDQESGITNSRIVSGAFSFPVPVDIKIGHEVKVVVISGPNTGGKTASMKTLGLASLMSKAGMYLPAENNPRFPWFDLVLADIGDHQSLEQSLSTFSGHISRINKILDVASENSLVLLDEIGSGTDPSEGVALSASILQYLKDRVKLAVVTTHYADLTCLKEKDARFENAAMEFSLESLQPTYRILWGSMGESNALTIAESIGFDRKIIERAKSWVKKLTPEKMPKLNSVLYQSLVEERDRLETQEKRVVSLHSDVMKIYHEILNEAEDLDGREAALKAKETQQIQQELEVVKTEIDAIVEEFGNQLRTTSRDQFNSLLKESESTIASIVEALQPSNDVEVEGSFHTPQLGEQVLVKGLGSKLATVVEAPADDNTVLVQYGKIRVRANTSSIKAPSDGKDAMSLVPLSRRKGWRTKNLKNLRSLSETRKDEEIPFGPAVQTSKNTIDLRGMRVGEATHHVSMAINERGSNSVLFIIHGMGTGVLKERVIQLLRDHPRIAKFEQESPMNYGCTIAYIK
ncbi:Endonuclease MutS2 [Olea europaea subsp. europaea]|uniref:Endonuclease MutS2 n=1 Tax=Olea europaea subsp. europaea TaxID=158383 RepID=A0A8S0URH8_OLEEU|nr:Endonuclease MutS2 [Olea europaea subsp. europaea]